MSLFRPAINLSSSEKWISLKDFMLSLMREMGRRSCWKASTIDAVHMQPTNHNREHARVEFATANIYMHSVVSISQAGGHLRMKRGRRRCSRLGGGLPATGPSLPKVVYSRTINFGRSRLPNTIVLLPLIFSQLLSST